MNAEMTMVEALKMIEELNTRATIGAIVSALVIMTLVVIIIFLSRQNDKVSKDFDRLKEIYHSRDALGNENEARLQANLASTQHRLSIAEQTIERLQGVKMGKEFSGQPSITGDAGSEDDIIKDSIGLFGPGGGSRSF
jgi:hypothetical protein